MIKRYVAKGISILLSTMMVASFMPVQAFAIDAREYYYESPEENIGDREKPVSVIATQDDVEVNAGDIKGDTGELNYDGGLYVYAGSTDGEPNTATVTTGNVTNADGPGVEVVTMGGNVSATINGDVSGAYNEDHISPWVAPAASAGVLNLGGTAELNVNGGVDGTNSVFGIVTRTYNNGTTNINVAKDVVSKVNGIMIGSTGDENETNIHVEGDVKATDDEGIGVSVSQSLFGIGPATADDPNVGKVNIQVDGTIEGKTMGVVLTEGINKENVKVTAWSITPNEDGAVAGYLNNNNDELVQDKDFEKNNILYIIKLEQPTEGATLSAVDTAPEGETVKLAVDLQDGYDITGAFNGLGEKVPLEMGADGKYYVVVPKGGGVYLSVTVGKKTKIRNPQPTNGESSNNNVENGASLCASIAQMIMNAAPGATVTANILSGLSLCKAVVDALEARPDVTLIVNYAYNNGIYSATIPPRTSDLSQYKNAAGGIDFETLTVNFNGKPIY